MLRQTGILLAAGMMIAVSCASDPQMRSVEPIAYNKRMLIAVSDIQNLSGNREYDPFMGPLTTSLTAELHETGCFRVIERQQLRSLMAEMQLGMTGLSDPAATRKIGKMAGAEALLFVNLATVKYDEKKDATFYAKNVKETIETIMDSRLVAVDTGEILAASKISIPVTNRYSSFCFFKDGEKADQKRIVQRTMDREIKHLAREIAWQVSNRGQ